MPAAEVEKAFKESLGDIQRFDDGKYLYRFFTGKFDVDKFNREFDQYKDNRISERERRIKEILDRLNKQEPETPAYNLPIGQIVINTKDAVLGILDDLLKLQIKKETFMKENRIFYLGIVFIFVAILLYLYSLFNMVKEEPKSGAIEIKLVN